MAYQAGGISAALFGLPSGADHSAPALKPTRVAFPPVEAATTEIEGGEINKKKRKADGDVAETKIKKAKIGAEVPVKKARDPEEAKRTIIVKNVPIKETAKSLRRALQLVKDQVESIRFRNLPVQQKFSNNKGLAKILKSYKSDDATQTAFVVLRSPDLIEDVLVKSRDVKLGDKMILADRVCPEDKFSKFDKIRTVFVGRLSSKHDEDFLLREFSQIGKVQNVRIVRDPKTSESKKFGFVCFEQKAAVPQAVAAYAKKLIDKRTLRVTKVMKEDEAKAVQERKALKGRHTNATRQQSHTPLTKLSKNKRRQVKAEASKQGASRRVMKKGSAKKQMRAKPSRKK